MLLWSPLGLWFNERLPPPETLEKKQGVSLEVVDPRTLVPLNKETIFESLRRTGRLVIMDEEPIRAVLRARLQP